MTAPNSAPRGVAGIGLRWVVFTVTVVVISMAVVTNAVLQRPEATPHAIASGSATPSPSLLPIPTEVPTPSPDMVVGELNLSQIAWWDKQTTGYSACFFDECVPAGSVPGDTFQRIRIGTMDGRITAVFMLDGRWSHSYVSGPTGGAVIIVDDIGSASTVRSVDAKTGSVTHLLDRADRIAAAVLGPSGEDFYYASTDRASGTNGVIWHRDLTTGEEQRLADAPRAYGDKDLDIWRMDASPDGRTLVAQFCHGAIYCMTYIMDLESRDLARTRAITWVRGFVGREIIGLSSVNGRRHLIAMNLDTLAERPALEREATRLPEPDTYNAEPPPGWVAEWPDRRTLSDPDELSFMLRNTGSGREVESRPSTIRWPTDCEPIEPAEAPGGFEFLGTLETLEAGKRWVAWGNGADAVVETMGRLPAPSLSEIGTPVTIRGHEGHLTFTDRRDAPPDRVADLPVGPTLQWEEGGCWYQVQLPGLTSSQALDYAARF